MRTVIIKEKSTGIVLAQVLINLQPIDCKPTAEQYRAEAWKVALADKLVELEKHDSYDFEVLNVAIYGVFSKSRHGENGR